MQVGSLLHFIASSDAPDAFSVQLNYTDKSITPKELREYLASLEDAGLISDGATERNKIVNVLFDTPDAGESVVTINTALTLSRKELLEITANDVETIARVAIDEQLKSWRRLPWADNALARLAKASNHDISELMFAWSDYSRSRIKRNLGITGTRMSKTQRHILYLVRGIGERAEELASFIAHWRQLDRIGRSVNDQVERLDDACLGEIRELHQDLIADLSAWVDARNWIVGLSREDVSPVAAAFLASLLKLSPGADEPLIPVIAWTDDGETRHLAVVRACVARRLPLNGCRLPRLLMRRVASRRRPVPYAPVGRADGSPLPCHRRERRSGNVRTSASSESDRSLRARRSHECGRGPART